MVEGSRRQMTDEERGGQEEPHTTDLKGNAAGLSLLTFSPPFNTPSCLWRNQFCPQMRSSSHSLFHWTDCPQGHLRPR